MLVTACTAFRWDRRRRLSGGIRVEKLADRSDRDQYCQSGRRAVDRVRPHGVGPIRLSISLGRSILTAGLTLALLILPMVIITTREAIRTVPPSIREAAYALGASKWQTVQDHVLPYSLGGILTGLIIALSRAIGESAPLMTIGALSFIAFLPHPPFQQEFPFLSFQWLMDPFAALPIQTFNWISRPQEEFHLNAAAAGLVLLGMTLAMNALAITVRARFRKRLQW